MFTVLDGLIVSKNTSAKKIIENITLLKSPNIGAILSSKVVALVLGITSIGPKQSIIISSIAIPNFLPARLAIFWYDPAFAMA